MQSVRKWAPWAVLIALAVAVLIVGVHRGGSKPTLDAQVQHIASEVRCPVCHGETVAQSQAAPSVQIRNQIRTDLQKGETQGQILGSLVASYGSGILEKPQAQGVSLLVWVVPVIAVVLGAAGLLVALRRWKRTAEIPATETAVPAVGPVVPAPSTDAASSPDPAPSSDPASSPDAGPSLEPAAALPGTTGPNAGGPSVEAGRRRPRRVKAALACAGVVLVAGGTSWAVAASSGTRLPGEGITGQALGAEAEAATLQSAQTDENKNDVLDAIKQYQKVLSSDPRQVQALCGEGWLLAETGQPSLLKQGLSLLVQAEQVQPSYGPAHLYRGLALLTEDDYADSAPELQWYLDHDPDQQLVPQVRSALAQAKSKAAAQPPAAPAG